MTPMTNMAIKAARAAGKIIIYAATNDIALEIDIKRRNDFVTQIDKKCEEVILETLHKAYPDHNFLGEETGKIDHSDGPYRWIIDPLDGTTNFIHKFPMVAVSIALQKDNDTILGVIYNPFTDDLFIAEKGSGASLNGHRIRVSDTRKLEGSFITAMVPKGNAFKAEYENYYANLQLECAGVRRSGSCALDLAYTACGSFDAFWSVGPKPWDIAAGALMVIEAGGHVCTLSGHDNYIDNQNILAATPKLAQELLPTLKQYYNAEQ
jgi:myo-inositol-1(or 4)-monophosphatase